MSVFENGVYFAPSPLMSTIPSWNPTIRPHVTTAAPSSTNVLPFPTVSTSLIIPGNTSPVPSTLQRGSTASFTGVILTLSPGRAMSALSDLKFSLVDLERSVREELCLISPCDSLYVCFEQFQFHGIPPSIVGAYFL